MSANNQNGSFSGVGNFDGRRIDGVASFPGGTFEELRVNGVATSEGDLTTGMLTVDGVFTCHGSVECTEMDADGVMTVHGNLRATTIDIDGAVTINGDKVEADRIVCDGALSAKGQISADTIDASGFVNAQEIVGDRISIQSYRKNFIFQAWLKLKSLIGSEDHSKVELIEATTINVRGVHALKVSGHDISIGPGCEIDRVDATGQLFIDPSSHVGEIVHSK